MHPVTVNLIAVPLLVAASAFFVAAEFALVRARGLRREPFVRRESAAARLSLRILSDLEAYLATCRLCIAMAAIGLGWLGVPAVAAFLDPLVRSAGTPVWGVHAVSLATAFAALAILFSLFGERVPKTLAIRRAEPLALWLACPLHAVHLLLGPFNRLLQSLVDALPGLAGERRRQGTRAAPPVQDPATGALPAAARLAGQVMIPRRALQLLDVIETPEHNLSVIRDSGHTRFPVIDSSERCELIGVVLAKDLHRAMLDGEREPWRELHRFCHPPLRVPEQQAVGALLDAMRAQRTHLACVTDACGELAGIVTLEDLLEELVGTLAFAPASDTIALDAQHTGG